MSFLRLLVLLAVVAFIGCGDGSESVTPVQETPPAEAVKAALEQAVKTGSVGSEIMAAIEKMKETDPALAAELEKDATAMMSGGNPAAVKAKAKAMLGKLGGGSAPAPPEGGGQ